MDMDSYDTDSRGPGSMTAQAGRTATECKSKANAIPRQTLTESGLTNDLTLRPVTSVF